MSPRVRRANFLCVNIIDYNQHLLLVNSFFCIIYSLQVGPNVVYWDQFGYIEHLHRPDSMWGTDYIANPFFLN